ncbi:MAG: biopolymer transporter ExbD [Ignavibacteriales bacterium]|nr:biopolymer transporter ExbD [Ignavibacteriales bacterium]
MKFRTEHKHLSAFSYASLTDVVLQLLIFFLLSSTFVIQSGIKVRLPRAQSPETGNKSQIVVTVTDRGAVFLNNEQVSKSVLRSQLSALLQQSKDQLVVIHADKSVSLQGAVEVMDIAKASGADRLLIATQTSPPTQ